ncbi:MAG TPA: rod-binding protein [Candidatus Rifleibacterium sp.]|nr:rod-binding protein [Candidatus Rifleibacterium sp.]HPT45175.1 rod-binding protein [Candidatus Rifleibacterium sp.]
MKSFSIGPNLVNNRSKELPEAKKKELEKLKQACNDFESIFMNQMLKEMRKTVKKTGLVHGGQAEEIFSDMLDEERSKTMQIGIGDVLFSQLSKSLVPPVRPR